MVVNKPIIVKIRNRKNPFYKSANTPLDNSRRFKRIKRSKKTHKLEIGANYF